MESAYFTPDIEDMSVGCEFEMDDTWGGWKKLTLTKELLANSLVGLGSGNERSPWYHNIRVPYLTKEQIEAEGWTSFITEFKGDIIPENMTYTFFKEDRNYMLGWNFNTNKITLIVKDPSLVVDYYIEPTFRGTCKDINTFRKICKLLGI